jgi:hypothetical protein
MLIVIAFTIGLVGAWVYAGCPLPGKQVAAAGPVREVAVSAEPAPGASTARS